jgi:hypothetical protein
MKKRISTKKPSVTTVKSAVRKTKKDTEQSKHGRASTKSDAAHSSTSSKTPEVVSAVRNNIAGFASEKVVKKTVKKIETKKTAKKPPGKIAKTLKGTPSPGGIVQGKMPSKARKPGNPQGALPREYGENDLLLMAVDPHTIFASWEITEDSMPPNEGELNARIFDANETNTGEDRKCKRFLDIKLDGRVQSGFFSIDMPGIDVMMEIGFFEKGGEFKAILRSNMVSIPSVLTFDELGIASKLFESGIPVGY